MSETVFVKEIFVHERLASVSQEHQIEGVRPMVTKGVSSLADYLRRIRNFQMMDLLARKSRSDQSVFIDIRNDKK